ncbi:CBASS cGAMP-activated phospholipase [Mesorhizobium kowhaii]|uniref:CBASS cGAMP-activated phospholipase n=1 Tax=Mesorhizobium kowhaii TaxID=1300272 RepID=UPI0035ECD63A
MAGIKRHRTQGTPAAATSPFQILSLSGGGYRGLFTAVILEKLEQQAGRPLRECFDLIAGTSIGGILACGIAAGIPASQMRDAFERLGSGIFDRRLQMFGRRLFPVPRLGLLSARYSQAGLEKAIDEVLGGFSERGLGSIGKPLLVPSVSSTNATTVLFESGAFAGSRAAVVLRDVALATAAAPTYFPEHVIGENSFVDGGIVANAPDAIVIIKAMSSFGRHSSELKLLSVGTAAEAMGEVFRPGRASGVLRWMILRDLFGLTVTAQQALAVGLVRELLGSRYVRIDILPDKRRGKAIGLDKAGRTAADTLKELARRALEDVSEQRGSDVAAMLRHIAAT